MTGEAADCCGCSPRRAVSDYIDRGLRRRRQAPLPTQGVLAHGGGGLSARFSLKLEDGAIAGVSFECSTCMTLVAYCELLCEMVERQTLQSAVRVAPADLASQFSQVPPALRDRAFLAVSALHSAVSRAVAQCAP